MGLALFAVSLIAARPPQPTPTGHDMSTYRAALAEGKKIRAIKLVRDDFPQLSLAKDFVESL